MKKVLIIWAVLFWGVSVFGQCFLDSSMVRHSSNVVKEEKTAFYYCMTRPITNKDTIAKSTELALKQYLFSLVGNSLYPKLVRKSVEVTDWTGFEDLISNIPSKGKCKKIKYVFKYALVFEDWINYEFIIPINHKDQVVSDGLEMPEINIDLDMHINTYCAAFDTLSGYFGDTTYSIQSVSIEYNKKEKMLDWVFKQYPERKTIQSSLKDLKFNVSKFQYYKWRVSFFNAAIKEEFFSVDSKDD